MPRSQTFNMPADGPVTLTEELRPVDMFRDLFRFFEIIRGEMFYTVNKTVTMTSKGDPACALLAKGIPLDELQNFPGDWEIPLMTNIRIVGSTFYIPDNDSHTLVTTAQFGGLIEILGLKSEVKMEKHPRLVADLSRKLLSNFDKDTANTCEMDAISLNIRLRLQQQLASVEKFWTNFRAVLSFYGQHRRFETLEQCIGSDTLSVKELISLPGATFDVCLKQMLAVTPTDSTGSRKTRDISILSRILGDGSEMIKIEQSLSSAINTFNNDFKRVESFTHQVRSSLQLLDEEMFTLLQSEGKIKSHMIDLELEIMNARNKMEYIIIKLQHLDSINQMLQETRLPEILDLLQRAALHLNICQLSGCETEIHTTRKNDSIFLHRTLVSLIPVEKFLIECKAISIFKISHWHNSIATKTSIGSYLINTTLVSELDLANETTANSQVRTMKKSERHLEVFNIYGRNLQCLKQVEFHLNSELLVCDILDEFPLPEDYVIEYGNRKLAEHKIVKHGQEKVLQTWLGSYSFDNVHNEKKPEYDTVVSLVHPALDDFLFTESGNIDIGNASIITGSTVLLGLCCTTICCCLCKPYRQCVVGLCTMIGGILYKGFTTKAYREKKKEEEQTKRLDQENQKLRADNERSRLTLEKSVRENNLVNEALQMLGVDIEDTNHLDDVSEVDQRPKQGEDTDKVRKKSEGRHAQSRRKLVTFSSPDQAAVAHLDERKGEKEKIKHKRDWSPHDPSVPMP